MKTIIPTILVVLCVVCVGLCVKTCTDILTKKAKTQMTESNQVFAIDSIDYHPSGKDNTLQVSPYWKCHLKGTNVWVRSTENREIGDSLAMIVKTFK